MTDVLKGSAPGLVDIDVAFNMWRHIAELPADISNKNNITSH